MADSRLSELLGVLSKQEMKEAGQYVSSPAINKDEKVVKLFQHITSCGKPYSEITKEEIIRAVFGKEEASNVYLRVVTTGLVRVIEKLLTDKKLEDDALKANLYLLETFRERGCRKSFNRHEKEIGNELEKANEKDAYYYLKLAEFRAECFLNSEEPERAGELLDEADNYIEHSYILFKLELYFRKVVLAISGQGKADTQKVSRFLKDVEADIKEIQKEHTLVYISYLSLKMLMCIDEKKNSYFTKLRAFLNKPLSENTTISVYRKLLTYCRLKRVIKNESSYGKEELKLYKQMLKEFPEYKPSPAEQEVIADCARSEGEMVWAEGVNENKLNNYLS